MFAKVQSPLPSPLSCSPFCWSCFSVAFFFRCGLAAELIEDGHDRCISSLVFRPAQSHKKASIFCDFSVQQQKFESLTAVLVLTTTEEVLKINRIMISIIDPISYNDNII